MIPPRTEAELLQRANKIAGLTLHDLATQQGQIVPLRQLYAKGWIGQLLETALGANAGSLSEPDFREIGVELKTIPINQAGQPKESTYICTVPLLDISSQTWRSSNVWRKLARVLWIPIEATPNIPLSERRIGNPLLWSPEPTQEKILQNDWETFAEQIAQGQLAKVSSKQGQYLQIRPKAAHSRVLCQGIGETGELIQTLPRGFYVRALFTAEILRRYYLL